MIPFERGMNLIINASSIYKGGAEQVALSFIQECIKFTENEYHVFLRGNIGEQLDIASFPENFHFYLFESRPGSSIKNYFRVMNRFNHLEKIIEPSCVISTGGHGYWRPKKTPLVGSFNAGHFIYSDSPFFEMISHRKRLYWSFMRKVHFFFYSRLDAVLVQTDDVKQRLKSKLTSKIPIYVVSNTVNANYLSYRSYPNKLPARKKSEIRLLTLSSFYPHKNLKIIGETVKVLKSRNEFGFRFVVTIPEGKFKELFDQDSYDMIYNTGPVPVKECPSLYEECDFMFLPTLIECFSASYIEAMVMKKPILTSDLGFAHTICKDAALYFDPRNADEIADKIIELRDDQVAQRDLIEKGLAVARHIINPEERAELFLSICKRMIKKEQ